MGRSLPRRGYRPSAGARILGRLGKELMSYRNLSNLDRLIRILLGAFMLAAGWSGLGPGVWGIALKVFGWVPLITGLIGWCPVYALLGIRTRRAESQH